MIGRRIKDLRREKDLLQKDLANELKLSQQTISLYESGKREPDYKTLDTIAKFFDVTIDYILGRTDIKNGVIIDKNNIPEELRNIDVDHLVVAKYAQDKSIDAETLKEIIDAISKKEGN